MVSIEHVVLLCFLQTHLGMWACAISHNDVWKLEQFMSVRTCCKHPSILKNPPGLKGRNPIWFSPLSPGFPLGESCFSAWQDGKPGWVVFCQGSNTADIEKHNYSQIYNVRQTIN